MNAKLGSQIAFGLHISTIIGFPGFQEGIGFAFGGEPRTQQLLLIR